MVNIPFPVEGVNTPVSQLRLGDVVKCFDGPFGTGTVVKVAPDMVTIQRPYGTTTDFAIGDPPMLIHYTGLETVSLWTSSPHPVLVYARKEVR